MLKQVLPALSNRGSLAVERPSPAPARLIACRLHHGFPLRCSAGCRRDGPIPKKQPPHHRCLLHRGRVATGDRHALEARKSNSAALGWSSTVRLRRGRRRTFVALDDDNAIFNHHLNQLSDKVWIAVGAGYHQIAELNGHLASPLQGCSKRPTERLLKGCRSSRRWLVRPSPHRG